VGGAQKLLGPRGVKYLNTGLDILTHAFFYTYGPSNFGVHHRNCVFAQYTDVISVEPKLTCEACVHSTHASQVTICSHNTDKVLYELYVSTLNQVCNSS